jgi:heme/copper-type cytochrome/quinol oxidase subunit 1
MLISVVGIIMIISTIIVVAYVGYSVVSNGITNEISSGTQYDELAELRSSYNNLSVKFDSVKATYYAGGPDDVKVYNDAKIELSRADSAIQNVQSALDAGKPSNEVDSRIEFAKEKLKTANQAYNEL